MEGIKEEISSSLFASVSMIEFTLAMCPGAILVPLPAYEFISFIGSTLFCVWIVASIFFTLIGALLVFVDERHSNRPDKEFAILSLVD